MRHLSFRFILLFLALTGCTRQVRQPYRPGAPAMWPAQVRMQPVGALTSDSARIVVRGLGGPIQNASVAIGQGTAAAMPVKLGAAVALVATPVRVHIRALGHGQVDTVFAADQIRGQEIEAFFPGVVATPPAELVRVVPWWQFWVW